MPNSVFNKKTVVPSCRSIKFMLHGYMQVSLSDTDITFKRHGLDLGHVWYPSHVLVCYDEDMIHGYQ